MTTKVSPQLLETALASGTYTPTLTNGTNISSNLAYLLQYLRVGNVVTVSGRVDVTPTSAGAGLLYISLPIASNMTSSAQAAGTCSTGTVSGAIYGDEANDRLVLSATFANNSAQGVHFQATYLIV